MKRKSLSPDGIGMNRRLGCDMNFEAGLTRSSRHRQAMGYEGPIFVGQVEQRFTRGLVHYAASTETS